MLYRTPKPTSKLDEALVELDDLRSRLAHEAGGRALWLGTLRRSALALAVESSTAIEGFSVPERRAIELVTGRAAADPGDESQLAVACYGRAMDRVGALADDPSFRWSDRVVLDLHFDVCQFQRDRRPGRWRTGPIWVTGANGQAAYTGPAADSVPGLMDETVEWLATGDLDAHAAVRAAMAHLHVVRVHPFEDGNGRTARIVQSLTLALEGVLSPEFASIEEYLRDHTDDYYAALRTTGQTYDPRRDASAWVEFCVGAHLAQARRRLDQIAAAARRWEAIEATVERHGWPDRIAIALEQALSGGTDRSTYCEEAGISTATATNDLRMLVGAGLIEAYGRGRSTGYEASDHLRGRTR